MRSAMKLLGSKTTRSIQALLEGSFTNDEASFTANKHGMEHITIFTVFSFQSYSTPIAFPLEQPPRF